MPDLENRVSRPRASPTTMSFFAKPGQNTANNANPSGTPQAGNIFGGAPAAGSTTGTTPNLFGGGAFGGELGSAPWKLNL
jgi:hypothetical protein